MSQSLLLNHANKAILENLKTLFEKQKLPHAFLFSGKKGLGKHQTAIELAQAILGPQSTFADLYKLYPESGLHYYTIDQIRMMQKLVACTPYEGCNRVFILDKADRLGLQPSNAFLKLLEEPPEGNYFILVSSQSYKLIPTLCSRLQKYEFEALSSSQLHQLMLENGTDLGSFAFLANGSIGQAQAVFNYKELLEQFSELLPYNYQNEAAHFKQLFEKLDDFEGLDPLEFIAIFEDLVADFYHFTLNPEHAHFPWKKVGLSHTMSLLSLSRHLKELSTAFSSGMKLSSCFERFFLNLH